MTVAATNSVIQADCSYEIDQYVVALYDGRWYIAKITDKDEDDEFPYQISFMEKKKKMFAWPKTPDVLWCKTSDIVYTINEPKPSGKSKRLFIIDSDLWEKLDNL